MLKALRNSRKRWLTLPMRLRIPILILVHGAIFGVLLGIEVRFGDDYHDRMRDVLDFAEDKFIPIEFFREMGTLHATVFGGLLVYLLAKKRRRLIPIFLAGVMAAAVTSQVLRPTLARERPKYTNAETSFQTPFTVDSPSLPSGHATVSMANATGLAFLVPQAAPIWYFGAVMCGMSRVETNAHFVSDVYLGFLVGYFMTNGTIWVIRRKVRLHEPGEEALDDTVTLPTGSVASAA